MSKVYVADKETLDKIYDIVSAEGVYGFIEHCATLAPGSRIEYIGKNADYTPISVTMGGGFSLGSWGNFSVLANNKPWMVNADGTPDYELNPDDYTKKVDGTASDVSNTSYAGGAFSWICKIWKKEYMVGDDRYVLFSETKKEGFEPVGFIDSNNAELEGVWLPMFYNTNGTTKATCIGAGQPEASNTTANQKTAIDAFGSRAKFFGGAIVETLQDLLIMWAKTTDLQGAYGKGNCSGYVNDATQNYGVLANAVVGGGQFYGTSDGTSLNKILHSIVLGTYQQWMRDPYTICVSGALKVSKNYAYDLGASGYSDTGVKYQSVSGVYPHKYRVVPGFGAVPSDKPYSGSTALGGCDGFWANPDITTVAIRFGACSTGLVDGVRALGLDNAATNANWSIGSAVLLLPPVGVAA